MKESYKQGLANQLGPESCDCNGNDAVEALTGVHAGRVLSCEIKPLGMPTLLSEAEGNTTSVDKARLVQTPRSRRPRSCEKTPCTEIGRPNRHQWVVPLIGWRRQCAEHPA